MSEALRELTITYGSYATNSSTRQVTGFTVSRRDRDRQSVEFDLVLSGAATAADFATECQATEAAFGNPYQNLTVAGGGSNIIAVTQSGNTGLDAMPRCEKRGQVGDTGRSRVYHVVIEYGVPATWNSTYPGLREVSVTLDYTPARRLGWTIAGTFTAITSNDAKAQYEAQIATLASATASWLSISSYELVDESGVAVSDNRKTTRFARTYRELIFTQAAAAVVEQHLVVTRDQRGIESQGGAVPLQGWSASYTAWLDAEVTTDLRGQWPTIRDFIMSQVKTTLNASGVALMSDAPSFNFDENSISASMSGLAVDPQGGSVIELMETITEDLKEPIDFAPAWNGRPFANYVFQTIAILTRTTVRRERRIGGGGGSAGGSSGGGGSGGGGGNSINGVFGFTNVTPIFGDGAAVNTQPFVPSQFDIDLTTVYPPDQAPAPGGGGGGANGNAGANGPGNVGAGPWYRVSLSRTIRPDLAVGRPNFLIRISETVTTTVERYAEPISAGAAVTG
jgi:uncharacterized membrane protein YgcG